MDWWYGHGHMGWMWIWWVLGTALVIAVIWLVSRSTGGRQGPQRESPEEILKRRYAEGEIEWDEYAQRLEDLRASETA